MVVAVVLMLALAGSLGLIALIRSTPWWQGPIVAVTCVLLAAAASALTVVGPPPSLEAHVAIAVATIGAATFAGWPVTAAMLHLTLKVPLAGPDTALPASGWVGLAERFGFTLALVLALPEVAALIVGVKALGSYSTPSESGNTTSAARVLGTLTSISWALFASVAFFLTKP